MQNTETVLGAIQERGRRGLTLERVYRQLFNHNLFLTAYGRIARKQGALTPGVTDETVDGMSLVKSTLSSPPDGTRNIGGSRRGASTSKRRTRRGPVPDELPAIWDLGKFRPEVMRRWRLSFLRGGFGRGWSRLMKY